MISELTISLLLGAAALLVCAIVTPLVRDVATRLSVLDHPDSDRKGHCRAVPRLGGIAVCVSCVASFGMLLASPIGARLPAGESLAFVLRLAPAGAIIFVTGVLDDMVCLKPKHKLFGQLLAAMLACGAGMRMGGGAGYAAEAWWSIPATIVWLVGCTNAFNLIDGLDGLAAGLGCFAAGTMFLAGVLDRNSGLAMASAPLAGALLGFLRYNFSPASIFLGDSGSLLIGFLLGCYGLIWSEKSTTVLGMMGPLMVMAIPLFDTALAIVRRFLRRRPIFSPDRGHIHHRLLDLGLSPRRAALLLYGIAAIGAALSLLHRSVRQEYEGIVLLSFFAAVLTGVYHLRVIEFDVVRQMILRGTFRRLIDGSIALRTLEDRLSLAGTLERRWAVVADGAREFGFSRVRLGCGGQTLEERLRDISGREGWRVRVPLGESGFIEFEHGGPEHGSHMIGQFVEVVCRQLQRIEAPQTMAAGR